MIEHEVMFYLGVLLLTYFIIKKIITYFHLELTYFDKDYLYPFLKK
ncbi:comD [Streptococcus oralis ATCC 35037]|nr:comD [Streptococcus oralis ATCC 35037]